LAPENHAGKTAQGNNLDIEEENAIFTQAIENNEGFTLTHKLKELSREDILQLLYHAQNTPSLFEKALSCQHLSVAKELLKKLEQDDVSSENYIKNETRKRLIQMLITNDMIHLSEIQPALYGLRQEEVFGVIETLRNQNKDDDMVEMVKVYGFAPLFHMCSYEQIRRILYNAHESLFEVALARDDHDNALKLLQTLTPEDCISETCICYVTRKKLIESIITAGKHIALADIRSALFHCDLTDIQTWINTAIEYQRAADAIELLKTYNFQHIYTLSHSQILSLLNRKDEHLFHAILQADNDHKPSSLKAAVHVLRTISREDASKHIYMSYDVRKRIITEIIDSPAGISLTSIHHTLCGLALEDLNNFIRTALNAGRIKDVIRIIHLYKCQHIDKKLLRNVFEDAVHKEIPLDSIRDIVTSVKETSQSNQEDNPPICYVIRHCDQSVLADYFDISSMGQQEEYAAILTALQVGKHGHALDILNMFRNGIHKKPIEKGRPTPLFAIVAKNAINILEKALIELKQESQQVQNKVLGQQINILRYGQEESAFAPKHRKIDTNAVDQRFTPQAYAAYLGHERIRKQFEYMNTNMK